MTSRSIALPRELFGLRRRDVDDLVDRHRAEVASLAASVDRLWREKEALAEELARTREELAATGRNGHETVEAEERVLSRLRREVTQQVADANRRLEDLLRVREHLLAELRGVLDTYGVALEDVDAGRPLRGLEDVTPATAPQLDVAAHIHTPVAIDTVFGPRVEISARPFDAFADLSSFERALGHLPTVRDVYIREFEDGAAVIELSFAEPRPLVHDLVTHVPYRLAVEETGEDRMTLRIDGPVAAHG
jgi:NifB/MoaA-like Fe-S oxidoreductase